MARKPTMDEFDFVRFAYPDLNGTIKGKLIPKRAFKKAVERGIPEVVGIQAFGPLSQLPEQIFNKIFEDNCPNFLLIPDLETLHAIPWAGHDGRIGQVLCSSRREEDLAFLPECPRYAAQQQIKKLNDKGYELLSCYEAEMMILEKDTRTPLFPHDDCSSLTRFAEHEDLVIRIYDKMAAANVPIECMHAEFAPGQFEFNLEPQNGILSADNFFKFKHGMKEICQKDGRIASFISKLDPKLSGNGSHFNISLWVNDTNVFYDSSKPDNFSDVARHFLGGLQNHADALTALCSSTVNCYRRLHQTFAPDRNDWAFKHRNVCFRVKAVTPEGTLIENRLPGGTCNPYLVVAGTLAAGIDGLERHLEPSQPLDPNAKLLPGTLQEALDALENNKVMRQALGDKIVDWFVSGKRDVDLKELQDSDVLNPNDLTGIEKEIEQYEPLC